MPFYESRMVRMVGLEPTCPAARDFKSLVYTNFTTLALLLVRKERFELSSLSALVSKTSVYTVPPLAHYCVTGAPYLI